MKVRGPVTGGSHGWPFGGPGLDLAEYGYRQDEYFLEGTASRFAPAPGSELGWDGRWTVDATGSSPYRTRILVVRPADPGAFKGTLLVFWNNVSAGYENIGGGESPEIFEGGYAYVAVTAQRVGVHGAPPTPQGLQAWDPERYGSLSVPSDDYSYDIFTQAASAVSPGRPRDGVDPLGGLEVQRMIATGGSQSAARLASYFNAIQPTAKIFDAFLLLLYFGGGAPLEAGDAILTVELAASDTRSPRIAEGTHLLRDDLDVPVMVVNTECEALSCYGVRQPDTDRFRYWEVAGASHVSLQGIRSSAPRLERDFGFSLPIDDATMDAINQVSIAPVVDAALHHLQRWLCAGSPPPVQPLIHFEGQPPAVARDADGIAQGGIRLPPVEVPVAHNSAIQKSPDVFARLLGSHEAFSAERLHELYPTREDYLARVEEAARAAEAASVVCPRDVGPMVEEAREMWPL